MTKLHKRKTNIFGKKVPVLLMALVLVAGIGSAALLGYFGQITGMATVDQSVTFGNGDTEKSFSFDDETFNAGETYFDSYALKNSASVPAVVELSTIQKGDGDHAGANNVEGIETKYWELKEDSYSLLDPDDDSEGSIEVTSYGEGVTFSIEPSEFSDQTQPITKTLVVDVENDGTIDYQVRYYDGDWQFAPVVDGEYDKWETFPDDITTSEEVSDENAGEYNISVDFGEYLSPDAVFGVQTMEHGTEGEVANIPIKSEFDWYNSSEEYPSIGTEIDGDLEMEAGENFDFVVTNEFDLRLVPKDYSVKTEIVPVTQE